MNKKNIIIAAIMAASSFGLISNALAKEKLALIDAMNGVLAEVNIVTASEKVHSLECSGFGKVSIATSREGMFPGYCEDSWRDGRIMSRPGHTFLYFVKNPYLSAEPSSRGIGFGMMPDLMAFYLELDPVSNEWYAFPSKEYGYYLDHSKGKKLVNLDFFAYALAKGQDNKPLPGNFDNGIFCYDDFKTSRSDERLILMENYCHIAEIAIGGPLTISKVNDKKINFKIKPSIVYANWLTDIFDGPVPVMVVPSSRNIGHNGGNPHAFGAGKGKLQLPVVSLEEMPEEAIDALEDTVCYFSPQQPFCDDGW